MKALKEKYSKSQIEKIEWIMDKRDRLNEVKNNQVVASEQNPPTMSISDTNGAVTISHLFDSDTDDVSEVENTDKNRSNSNIAPHKRVKNIFKSVFKFKKNKKTDGNSSDGYQSDTQSVVSEVSIPVIGNENILPHSPTSSIPTLAAATPYILSTKENALLSAFIADLSNEVFYQDIQTFL